MRRSGVARRCVVVHRMVRGVGIIARIAIVPVRGGGEEPDERFYGVQYDRNTDQRLNHTRRRKRSQHYLIRRDILNKRCEGHYLQEGKPSAQQQAVHQRAAHNELHQLFNREPVAPAKRIFKQVR